jgi:hypothetical protein
VGRRKATRVDSDHNHQRDPKSGNTRVRSVVWWIFRLVYGTFFNAEISHGFCEAMNFSDEGNGIGDDVDREDSENDDNNSNNDQLQQCNTLKGRSSEGMGISTTNWSGAGWKWFPRSPESFR